MGLRPRQCAGVRQSLRAPDCRRQWEAFSATADALVAWPMHSRGRLSVSASSATAEQGSVLITRTLRGGAQDRRALPGRLRDRRAGPARIRLPGAARPSRTRRIGLYRHPAQRRNGDLHHHGFLQACAAPSQGCRTTHSAIRRLITIATCEQSPADNDPARSERIALLPLLPQARYVRSVSSAAGA